MDSTALIDERQAPSLATLAAQINEHHRAVEEAMTAGLQHALEAGKLLTKAKALVKHGEWIPWLDENFDGSARLAQRYMRVVDELPKLEANTTRVSHLSFREACRLLAEPQPKPSETAATKIPALRQRLESAETLNELVAVRGWQRRFCAEDSAIRFG